MHRTEYDFEKQIELLDLLVIFFSRKIVQFKFVFDRLALVYDMKAMEIAETTLVARSNSN